MVGGGRRRLRREIWQEWEGGENKGGGVETVGGDGSETGLVTKKKGEKNRRPVSDFKRGQQQHVEMLCNRFCYIYYWPHL